MNYRKIYLNIISRAIDRINENNKYYEEHHIIPKSIFSNEIAHKMINIFGITLKYGKENKVELLPEEHYIVHLLLVKIFEKVDTNCYERMVYAANFMSNRSNKFYCLAKKRYSKILSEKRIGIPSGMSGKKWSQERLEIGQKHLKGKTYEEIHGKEKAEILKKNKSMSMVGKTWDEKYGLEKSREIKNKLSKKNVSDDTKKKISQSKLGKKTIRRSKSKNKTVYVR